MVITRDFGSWNNSSILLVTTYASLAQMNRATHF